MKPYLEAKSAKEICKLLGLPESDAARVQIRCELVQAIRHTITRNGWTHQESASMADVGRTVITSVVNGNIARISTDKLISIAHKLGLKMHLRVA